MWALSLSAERLPYWEVVGRCCQKKGESCKEPTVCGRKTSGCAWMAWDEVWVPGALWSVRNG